MLSHKSFIEQIKLINLEHQNKSTNLIRFRNKCNSERVLSNRNLGKLKQICIVITLLRMI